MGVTDIRTHPTTLPEERRVAERDKLIAFLRNGLATLESQSAGG
jgi:hypothetical protein